MVVTVVISLMFLSFSCAQISITGSEGRNFTIQGQRYGIYCTVSASLDTSIVMLKGLERVCSLLMESCPILPSERFPCGCSVNASGDRVLYHTTDNATVQGFNDVWHCKEFNSTKNNASVDVTVYSGPDNIRLNSSSRVRILGDVAAQAVQCSADCNPQCSYFWYKGSPDTAPVAFGQRVLSAEIIQKQLPGNQVYTCVAINRMKPIHKIKTIVLDVDVVPLPAPLTPREMSDVSLTNSSTTNTPRLTVITTKTIVISTPTIQQTTTIQSTTTTTVPTTTTTTTTTTITTSTSTSVKPVSPGSDAETATVVGTIVGVIIGLIVIVVVTIFVVLFFYKRGQRQTLISRTISNAPGNPIYANNPGTVGGTPNLQGTLLVGHDEDMNYSQDTDEQNRVRSPIYVNTTQPNLYSSLEKVQLEKQPSNTYEQLGVSQTLNPEYNPYTQLDNQQKQGSSEAQSNLGGPGSTGSPVYMNFIGYDKKSESTKMDTSDVSEEPVSLEYMNLNVSRT